MAATPRVATRLETWSLDRLYPSPANARTHPSEQIAKLAESLRTFGWVNPVLADPSGEIVAGEARWHAARKAGLAEASVIVLDGLSPVERAAYRVADNRLAEDAGWDEEKLQRVLQELEAVNFNLAALGFDEEEVADFLAKATPQVAADPDVVPEPPSAPVTQLGDIWELGPHRLICGDSTKPETLDALMGARLASVALVDLTVADLIFTDPPYGMAYGGGRAAGSSPKGARVKAHGMIMNDDAQGDALVTLVREALSRAVENARPGSAVYVCLTWRTDVEFKAALKGAGLDVAACIVWDKGHIGLGQQHYRPQHEFIYYCRGERWYGTRAESDVWDIPRDAGKDYVHPTQKPVALIERAIENSSRRGDVVLDVFGGSGSTLIACERTLRLARLVELDPRYCDVIVERWKRITGRTPVRRPAMQPTATASESAKPLAASA